MGIHEQFGQAGHIDLREADHDRWIAVVVRGREEHIRLTFEQRLLIVQIGDENDKNIQPWHTCPLGMHSLPVGLSDTGLSGVEGSFSMVRSHIWKR